MGIPVLLLLILGFLIGTIKMGAGRPIVRMCLGFSYFVIRAFSFMHWKTYGEQKHQLMGAIMQPSTKKSTHRRDGHNQVNRCVIV